MKHRICRVFSILGKIYVLQKGHLSRLCAILLSRRARPLKSNMTQLDEAIHRYHRILESEPYRDLRWVKNLQEQMEARQLSTGGRLLCPFLRPNFVTQKQYDNLVKT